jgi:hypothetical protein
MVRRPKAYRQQDKIQRLSVLMRLSLYLAADGKKDGNEEAAGNETKPVPSHETVPLPGS